MTMMMMVVALVATALTVETENPPPPTGGGGSPLIGPVCWCAAQVKMESLTFPRMKNGSFRDSREHAVSTTTSRKARWRRGKYLAEALILLSIFK